MIPQGEEHLKGYTSDSDVGPIPSNRSLLHIQNRALSWLTQSLLTILLRFTARWLGSYFHIRVIRRQSHYQSIIHGLSIEIRIEESRNVIAYGCHGSGHAHGAGFDRAICQPDCVRGGEMFGTLKIHGKPWTAQLSPQMARVCVPVIAACKQHHDGLVCRAEQR